MIEITLYTSEGHAVAAVPVPPFVVPVDVISWGVRTFVRRREDGRYYEAVSYRVPSDAGA